jgi:XTP/dITP diphosphohydrolase
MKVGAPLIVASHNAGKVREILELLAPFGFDVKGAAELGLPEPEETGSTFAENAILKARAAADATGLLSLADDSGLAVNALNGAPGIYAARWAGPSKNFADAMARVERELKNAGAQDRSAKFVCALALAEPHGETHVFEGDVSGRLVFPPRGTKGFGYDPIFIADGMHETFAEIGPSHKHAISHRARAFAKLAAHLSSPACGHSLRI